MAQSAMIFHKILFLSPINRRNNSWNHTAVRAECAEDTHFNTCFLVLIFDRMVTSKGIFTKAKITGKS